MDIKKVWKDESAWAIARESWAVSWPMTFVMFYEFLIGLTDVYVAGRFGKDAQAAYGFAFQLYFVFIIIGIALSVGVVSVTARLFTSGKTSEFSSAVSSALVSAAMWGGLFGLAGIFFSKDLIRALDLPAGIKPLAAPFMMIYSMAFMFDYVLMSANGILRACGMVRKSLLVMSVVCIMNIALDFLLAFNTPLGLNGIAAATVISLAAGALMSLYFTGKLAQGFSFSVKIVKDILNISWPSGLLQAFWQLGSLVLFLILGFLPRNNTEIMAALTNGLKIESAIFLPVFAFNMGAAVVVGNFLGKENEKDAFRGGIITALMGVIIAFSATVFVMLNAPRIAAFLSSDPIVVSESVKYIYIALISEPFMAWGVILGGGLNGAGDTRSVMLITGLGIWAVRIPLSYIFGVYFGFGASAVWWAMNLSVLTQAVLITHRYFSKKWVASLCKLTA